MTIDPAAKWMPVPSHGGAMTAHLGLIIHSTTNGGDPWGYFSNPDHQASSTWWISDDGRLEQYVDADLRAWAQAAGNATYDSVECSGTVDEPFTPAQVKALAALYAWGHGRYGWPFHLANTPSDRGLGWHGMGRGLWGNHPGCPGVQRVSQRAAILDAAGRLVSEHASQGHVAPHPAVAAYRYPRQLMLGCGPGDDVKHLQARLGITADGVFGARTKVAVERFQAHHGLPVDGVVGPATGRAIG